MIRDDSNHFRFHHVGLACRKMKTEIMNHKHLGYAIEGEPFFDPIQRIHGIFMVNGAMRIELLEPTSQDSPVMGILTRGHKMYHQGFECEDIQKAITFLEYQGARLISPPAPAVAFNGRQIAFLMLRTLMIVELINM